MNNWIGPKVKQLWIYAMRVLHKLFGFNINTTASSWADTAFISYY